MAKKKVQKIFDKNKKEDDKKTFAFIATFLSIIGFVIALIARRDDKYVMYYASQSLVVFIVGAVAGVLSSILGWIPIIGWIISFALFVVVALLWLFSWLGAISGEMKPVPVVGEFGEKIKL
jgi:uncharacterized membrane protein